MERRLTVRSAGGNGVAKTTPSRLLLALMLLGAATAAAEAATGDQLRRAIRQDLLERINQDRLKLALPPVALDLPLSRFADAHCERQIAEGTIGHFTLDGIPPYARYSQAGATAGVAENAVAWSAPYVFTQPAILDVARRSHEAMIAETPPRDSHRRAILDPWATHVAIGSAWHRGEIRLVQVFLRRHIDWTTPPPATASSGSRFQASGKAGPGWTIDRVTLHHEALSGMTRDQANRIESYSLPEPARLLPFRNSQRFDRPPTVSDWARAAGSGDIAIEADGSFSLRTALSDGPGIYTIVVWLRRPGLKSAVEGSHVSTIVPPSAGGSHAIAGGAR